MVTVPTTDDNAIRSPGDLSVEADRALNSILRANRAETPKAAAKKAGVASDIRSQHVGGVALRIEIVDEATSVRTPVIESPTNYGR
jgi:hypothetical protein